MKRTMPLLTVALAALPFARVRAEAAAAEACRAQCQSLSRAELLARSGRLVTPDEVRADEWVNYQDYTFPRPPVGERVGLHAAACPLPAYLEAPRRAYLMLAITTEPYESERTQPIDVVVVLDRSGSMSAAGKMEYAKQAIMYLAANLTEEDRLGIVSFSTGVEVTRELAPWLQPSAGCAGSQPSLQAMTGGLGGAARPRTVLTQRITELRRTLDTIAPGGSTNLHGGLTRGMGMLLRHDRIRGTQCRGRPAVDPQRAARRRSDRLTMQPALCPPTPTEGLAGRSRRRSKVLTEATARRLLVMTDGVANVGETSPERIAADLAPGFDAGVRLTAIGVGLEYNDPLMRNLTRIPGNNGRFLDSPEEIRKSMVELFDSVMPLVVDKPDLAVVLPEGIRVVEGFNAAYVQTGREVRFPRLTSLGADDHEIVLVEVEGPAGPLAELDGAWVTLDATNAAEKRRIGAGTRTSWLGGDEETASREGGDLLASAFTKATAVARAATALRGASELAGRKDLEGARRIVTCARADLAAAYPEGLPGGLARVDGLLKLDLDVLDRLAGRRRDRDSGDTMRAP